MHQAFRKVIFVQFHITVWIIAILKLEFNIVSSINFIHFSVYNLSLSFCLIRESFIYSFICLSLFLLCFLSNFIDAFFVCAFLCFWTFYTSILLSVCGLWIQTFNSSSKTSIIWIEWRQKLMHFSSSFGVLKYLLKSSTHNWKNNFEVVLFKYDLVLGKIQKYS